MAVITWTLKNTGTKTQIFSASRVDSNPQRSEISRHGLRWVRPKGYRCRSNKWQEVFFVNKNSSNGITCWWWCLWWNFLFSGVKLGFLRNMFQSLWLQLGCWDRQRGKASNVIWVPYALAFMGPCLSNFQDMSERWDECAAVGVSQNLERTLESIYL